MFSPCFLHYPIVFAIWISAEAEPAAGDPLSSDDFEMINNDIAADGTDNDGNDGRFLRDLFKLIWKF